VTYATVVLAELAPKYLALERALQLALWTAYPLDVFHSLMRPFINVINGSAFGVLRLFGVRPGVEAQAHSAEELRMLVAASTRTASSRSRSGSSWGTRSTSRRPWSVR